MKWEKVSLLDISEGGIMVDGDWIESKDQDPKGGIRLLQLADIGDGFFINKSKRYINKKLHLGCVVHLLKRVIFL